MNAKIIILLLSVIIILAVFVVCQRKYKSSKALKETIKTLIVNGAKVFDVRSQGEFRSGHYKGAINIPLNDVKNRIKDFGDKDKPVIVYCRSGRRSGIAKTILEKNGYKKVFNGGGLNNMPE